MEDHFSPKGKETGYCTSPCTQLEESTSVDGGMKKSASEDMFSNFSELMNFDTYAGWSNSSSMTYHSLANVFSSFSSASYPPSDGLNLVEHGNGPCFMTEVSEIHNGIESSPSCEERGIFQQMDIQLGFLDEANDSNSFDSEQNRNGSYQQFNTSDMCNYMISRSSGRPLDDRMLRALSFFMESVDEGMLAQVWVPIKHGDEFILCTSEQPYLLDPKLAGYREVSRAFTFSAEGKKGSCPGLPARVFTSHVPEWTSNVGYYNKTEYLRLDHALNHDIRGSIALPVSDMHSHEPCAVLELVTTKEKPNFDRELEIVTHALQVIATGIATWLVDKSGRRLLLMISSCLMTISLVIVSAAFYLEGVVSEDSHLFSILGILSVVGLVVMVIGFSLGLGPIPWLIMSEILPVNIKGLAGSIATMGNWLIAWVVTMTANLLLNWSSGGTFTIYAVVVAITIAFIAKFVPETKGRTLEEIQFSFR